MGKYLYSSPVERSRGGRPPPKPCPALFGVIPGGQLHRRSRRRRKNSPVLLFCRFLVDFQAIFTANPGQPWPGQDLLHEDPAPVFKWNPCPVSVEAWRRRKITWKTRLTSLFSKLSYSQARWSPGVSKRLFFQPATRSDQNTLESASPLARKSLQNSGDIPLSMEFLVSSPSTIAVSVLRTTATVSVPPPEPYLHRCCTRACGSCLRPHARDCAGCPQANSGYPGLIEAVPCPFARIVDRDQLGLASANPTQPLNPILAQSIF